MTVSPLTEDGDALARVRRENETLYAVIKTVSSSLSLDRVLGAIVDIATDATGSHASFIYFLEGDRLVLRAASPRYSELVGKIELGIDEGLTGWVARNKAPEFIRERALEDPRIKYVPELEEERFQSMVAVPILARAGDVIGVIVLHTVAPREFEHEVLNFLIHTASLVAGAIENAQLYEEARRRVDALTTLTELSQSLAAVTHAGRALRGRDARGAPAAVRGRLPDLAARPGGRPAGARRSGPARRRRDPARPRGAAARPDAPPAGRPARSQSGVEAPDGGDERLLLAPLVAGEEQLGILSCVARGRSFGAEDAELLVAVANQTAVGLKKAELIERLTAENIVKDMFDALAAGAVKTGEAKAAEARCDLTRAHVFVHAEPVAGRSDGPPWPELAARVQARLARPYPRALFDARHDGLRALVPLPRDEPEAAEALWRECDELARAEGLEIGLSDADRGAAGARRRMREAADAASIGRSLSGEGGAVSYEQLGAYRYLVHLELDETPHDRYGQAVDELIEYDRRRNAQLVETLERYLGARCSVAASARSLYIHPNTVRQRLERIERLTGLELRQEDLLSLELALKVARLHRVRGE